MLYDDPVHYINFARGGPSIAISSRSFFTFPGNELMRDLGPDRCCYAARAWGKSVRQI